MSKPSGKLKFAYETIANMELKIESLREQLDTTKADLVSTTLDSKGE